MLLFIVWKIKKIRIIFLFLLLRISVIFLNVLLREV